MLFRSGEIGLIVDADDEVGEVGQLMARSPGWSGGADSCDCGTIRETTSSEDMLATEL